MLESLRGRLMLVMAIVFSLGVGNVVIYLLDLDNEVRAHVLQEQIDTLLAARPQGADGSFIDTLPLRFSESDWRYALYDPEGRLMGTRPADQPPLPFMRPAAETDYAKTASEARALPNGQILVIRRNDWSDCEELCQIFRERLAGSAALIVVLAAISLLSMLLFANWILTSIKRATVLAATIGRDNPDQRIPLEGLPKEILPLAAAANTAFDRLAEAYVMEKRFTADAAHELRTPLTVLDLRIQKARLTNTPDWGAITGDMIQMRRLIDQLLDLARADRDDSPGPDHFPIPLARAVRQAAADIHPAYEARGRHLDMDLEEGLHLRDGSNQLRQAMRNLLENALNHGQGIVHVQLAASAESQAQIIISDEGPAVSVQEGEKFFERFSKGRQSRNGSGLGLAIARTIVRNLGGTLTMGSAATFTLVITLPLHDMRG